MHLSDQRIAALFLSIAVSACSESERRFESVCQIVRRDVVERDARGNAAIIDLELEWDPCPGAPCQVVCGGTAFAACMQQYQVGALLPVLVKQWWDERGYYTWDVYKVGACTRPIELHAEGSYEKSQDCRDKIAYGKYSGFTCNRRPFKELLAICPWMARD